MISKYLGEHCEIANSTIDFITKVIDLAKSESNRDFDKIKAGIYHVSHNHTYFNRLQQLFSTMELFDCSEETKVKGERVAVQHCWELNARLSAEERGVSYEDETITNA